MRLLELGRRDVPDLAVQSPLVEPVDVLGDGDLDIADRRPAALRPHRWVPDALALEQRVERLGHRVVIRIAFTSNGSDGIGFGEALGVADGAILDSSVAVVDEPGRVLPVSAALPQPHIERVECEFCAQARGHRQPTTSLLNTSITNAA